MVLHLKELSYKNGQKIVEAIDEERHLHALIAIHNTHLGPALGGTRIFPYKKLDDALFDVSRLAEGMTYKSALARTGFGGGKSVIIANPQEDKNEALLHAFAEAVHALEGEYICAEDVGSTASDMMIIRQITPYVAGLPVKQGSGDPGRFTAYGVYHGLKAVAKKLWGSPSLSHKIIAIQGLGSVGSRIAEFLFWEGAHLIVSDFDRTKAEHFAKLFHADLASPEEILTVPCDIFCPCALGGVLNEKTIASLNTTAVAGAANNQLLHMKDDSEHLAARGILYAPDYVINAGGVINVSHELHADTYNAKRAMQGIAKIGDTLFDIFTRAELEQIPPSAMALKLAKELIEQRIGKREGNPFFPPIE